MLRYAAAIFTFFLGLYGLTFHGFVDVEDVEVCYLSTRNLVEHGSLALGESDEARRSAEEGFFVARGPDGAVYPIYPLAQLVAPVPFYLAGRALSPIARERPDDVVRMAYAAVNVLAGALLCVVVFLLGRRLGQSAPTAAATALLAGTCTMLWAYAQGTFADLPLALCTSMAAWCVLSVPTTGEDACAGRGARLRLVALAFAAGVFSGLALLYRPAALLLCLPNLLYLRRAGLAACVLYVLALAALAAAALYVDTAVLGRPLAAGYAGRAVEDAPLLTHSYGLSLFGLLFSDGKGLFMLAPILFLAILAFPRLWARDRHRANLVAGYLAVLALFFAAFDGWYGGWCWGPRYLLPAVPLVAAVAGCFPPSRARWQRGLVALLVLASLWIQVLSVAVPNRIYMTMISSHGGADLTQFFYYTRFSPVLAHQEILLHKLQGQPDVYSQHELFGEPDPREIDVTAVPAGEISRFNAGFDHFAWVRVFQKGHRLWAVGLALGCALLALGGGLWLRRLAARERIASAIRSRAE